MATLKDPLVISADEVVPIPVNLVGVDYKIKPPKAALALKLAVQAKTAGDDPTVMVGALFEWVDIAFGTESKKVRARLDDPEDLLDVVHINALMEAVLEMQTDLPPT